MAEILVSLHGRKIGLSGDNKLVMSKNDGSLVNMLDPEAPPASGDLSQAAAQADSTASDAAGLKTDFNALLAKLRAAGLLATA